jgi:hypothetical protein
MIDIKKAALTKWLDYKEFQVNSWINRQPIVARICNEAVERELSKQVAVLYPGLIANIDRLNWLAFQRIKLKILLMRNKIKQRLASERPRIAVMDRKYARKDFYFLVVDVNGRDSFCIVFKGGTVSIESVQKSEIIDRVRISGTLGIEPLNPSSFDLYYKRALGYKPIATWENINY